MRHRLAASASNARIYETRLNGVHLCATRPSERIAVGQVHLFRPRFDPRQPERSFYGVRRQRLMPLNEDTDDRFDFSY
jgi:hypothetical protein